MTALKNLIRLHRWSLDEKRRNLADLEGLLARMSADLRKTDAEIAEEAEAAGQSLEAARSYPAYAEAAKRRRNTLAASIVEIQGEIERTRDEVNECYQEVKKYELALSNREQKQRSREARREQLALDELGLEMHRRRQA